MTTTHINGNSRVVIDHTNSTYSLQHPHKGGHKNWQDVITADSPESFLNDYLNRNLRRIKAQPQKVAENIKTILTALCVAP